MATPKNTGDSRFVRRETLLLFTCGALFAGFIGGLLLGIYSSEPGAAGRPPAVSGPPETGSASNELAAAIEALENRTRENPDDPEAWTGLGNAYFDSGQYPAAIVAYEKALELDADNANVWTDLGIMYRRTGQPQEAVRAFDRASKVDSKHEIALMNKGIVLLHDLRDPSGAIRAWEDLLAINPLAMAPSGVSVDQMVQQLKKQQAATGGPGEN
jgi:cytochrome c-type biogenesis protein CcmH/NrfG